MPCLPPTVAATLFFVQGVMRSRRKDLMWRYLRQLNFFYFFFTSLSFFLLLLIRSYFCSILLNEILWGMFSEVDNWRTYCQQLGRYIWVLPLAITKPWALISHFLFFTSSPEFHLGVSGFPVSTLGTVFHCAKCPGVHPTPLRAAPRHVTVVHVPMVTHKKWFLGDN